MKDLDFDELDKAVSSLMGSVPASDEATVATAMSSAPTTNPPEPTVIESTDVGTDAPLAATDPLADSSDTSETPKDASPVVRPSSGRFMDVVHPSSDMKLATKPPRPRETVSIAPPVSSASVDTTIDSALPEESPLEDAPAQLETQTEPTSQSDEPSTSWPDPINFAAQAQEPTPESAPETIVPPLEDTALTQPEEKVEEPLLSPTSPFLPDAKVEKRPLGSSEESSTLATGNEGIDSTVVADEAPTPPEGIDAMPAELGQDVLAIESGENTELSADTTTQETNTATAASEAQAPDPIDQSATVSTPTTVAAVAAGGSIAQQYKAKPDTGNQHHEALYDAAANDTTTLQHPAKKKSGWLVIIWVVLLIALGVGGALALYYFNVI
jgi:hypothetical protein